MLEFPTSMRRRVQAFADALKKANERRKRVVIATAFLRDDAGIKEMNMTTVYRLPGLHPNIKLRI